MGEINLDGTFNIVNKSIEDILMKAAEKILADVENELDTAIDKCVKETDDDMLREAENMYDDLIGQYYEYRTKSYYRHVSGRGTGWGDNLYYGKNFTVADGDLNIEFSGAKMAKYKKASPEEVLSIVRAGFRGVPGKWIVPWSGSYDGEYFSIGNTNIDDAFEIFLNNYEYIYDTALRSNYKSEIKKGKYKYLK